MKYIEWSQRIKQVTSIKSACNEMGISRDRIYKEAKRNNDNVSKYAEYALYGFELKHSEEHAHYRTICKFKHIPVVSDQLKAVAGFTKYVII